MPELKQSSALRTDRTFYGTDRNGDSVETLKLERRVTICAILASQG